LLALTLTPARKPARVAAGIAAGEVLGKGGGVKGRIGIEKKKTQTVESFVGEQQKRSKNPD